ncbi:PREDICTED: serine protease inhibitor dipetalogastin-like [Nicrophorus vespilloides]|uniref:Serine protease inhibitor dipetalogastin-like n=1 Tax=Nicrophorus vespilloides TaxID=110193 RepID=A0ABM1M2K3_NICVS|nr:PREDICTED: serine protease inhibitor dipetalogastin-like [Nicrophorus vespilloides]
MKCILIVVLAASIGAQAVDDPICPLRYSPICASDGITYGNQCSFDYAVQKDSTLTILFRGTCEYTHWDEIACNLTENRVEVCGSDGVSYKNQCLFNFAVKRNPSLRKRHDGKCEDSVKSARNGPMVCGTDGKLYDPSNFLAQQSVRPQLGEWPMNFCVRRPGEPMGPSPRYETPTVCGSDLLVYFEPDFIAQQAIRSNLHSLPLSDCYFKPFFQQ